MYSTFASGATPEIKSRSCFFREPPVRERFRVFRQIKGGEERAGRSGGVTEPSRWSSSIVALFRSDFSAGKKFREVAQWDSAYPNCRATPPFTALP